MTSLSANRRAILEASHEPQDQLPELSIIDHCLVQLMSWASYSRSVDVDMLSTGQAQLVLWRLELKSEQAHIVAQFLLFYQPELLLFARIECNCRAALLFGCFCTTICNWSWSCRIGWHCNKISSLRPTGLFCFMLELYGLQVGMLEEACHV